MIKENIRKAINTQINKEFFSAYLYLSMATYFEENNLNGFANWMKVQAQEEMSHGMKMYNYINQRGGRVILEAIDAPKTKWATPLEAFEDAYEHETKVTAWINEIVDLSVEEKDHATYNMLQWFVDEQVEEEANADDIIHKLKFIKNSPHALFMLDREFATRVFVDETQQK